MTNDHPHSSRRRTARIFLAIIALALAAVHGAFWIYATDGVNPWPFLKGFVPGFGAALLLLLVAMWRRHGWARYLALSLLWIEMGLFTWSLMNAWSEPEGRQMQPAFLALAALPVCMAATVVLIRSKRIQHLVTRASSGG